MSSESLLLLLLGGQAAGVRDRGVCAGADVTARSAIVCCACRRRRQQSDLDGVIVNNRLTPARLRPRAPRRLYRPARSLRINLAPAGDPPAYLLSFWAGESHALDVGPISR